MNRFVILLVLAVALPLAAAEPDTLPAADRVFLASQIYSTIQMYFGHWKAVPGLDLDAEYQRYLQQVLASDSRRDFDLASLELVAKLENGHSGFGDEWMRQTFGQPFGFFAVPIGGQWVVARSSLDALKPGDALAQIDGEPLSSFYARLRKYINASNERWRQRSLFERPYLFPESFTLTLASGRAVSIHRHGEFQWPGDEFTSINTSERDGVAILRVPSFNSSVFEDSAVDYLRKLPAVRAVILDLRGNHGGSTPIKLFAALMDRPYRFWSESTPATIGVLQVENGDKSRADLVWTSDVIRPEPGAYKGPLYILIDGGCFSACEDAVVPFKDNHRAVILGETTGGSSGQPYQRNLRHGMGISVSTKREYFPDGSAFEGVGIAPDIEVPTTAADLASGQDPVLAKALALAMANSPR